MAVTSLRELSGEIQILFLPLHASALKDWSCQFNTAREIYVGLGSHGDAVSPDSGAAGSLKHGSWQVQV